MADEKNTQGEAERRQKLEDDVEGHNLRGKLEDDVEGHSMR